MVEQYYETTLLQYMDTLGKDYIVWQDVFDNGLTLKPSTVVDVWKGDWQSELGNVTAAGYRSILSAPWYLNYINYGNVWVDYYQVEPLDFNGTTEQQDLVIGGEACLWGEFVDSTNFMPRMWPFVGAIGERLYSPMDTTNLTSAANRLQVHTCRLIKRGINAQPPNGPSFCYDEFYPYYRPPWEQ